LAQPYVIPKPEPKHSRKAMIVRQASTNVAGLFARSGSWKSLATVAAPCMRHQLTAAYVTTSTTSPSYAVAAFVAGVAVAAEMAKPTSQQRLVCAETKPKSALTHLQVMDLSNILVERVSIPMVPAGIQEKVLSEVVQHVSDELPNHLTPKQLQAVRRNIDLASNACNISAEEREKLVKALSTSINVPLLPADMREKVAGIVVDELLGDASLTSVATAGVGAGGGGVVGAASTLLDEKGRKNLAHRMAEKLPALPMMSKEQEEAMLEKFINTIAEPLEAAVPVEWRSGLHGASAKEIEKFKEQVVADLEAKLPGIPLLSKEKETEILRAVVDAAFESFLDHSGMDGIVLSPEIQLERIKEAEKDALEKLELVRRRNKRQEAAALRQVASIREQKAKLQKEVNRLHHVFTKAVLAASAVVGLVAYFAGVCK